MWNKFPRLRQNNLNIKIVTNTTKESRRSLYEKLCNLGFKLKNDDIWSSLWAAREAIVTRSLKPLLLLSSDALEDFQGELYPIYMILPSHKTPARNKHIILQDLKKNCQDTHKIHSKLTVF